MQHTRVHAVQTNTCAHKSTCTQKKTCRMDTSLTPSSKHGKSSGFSDRGQKITRTETGGMPHEPRYTLLGARRRQGIVGSAGLGGTAQQVTLSQVTLSPEYPPQARFPYSFAPQNTRWKKANPSSQTSFQGAGVCATAEWSHNNLNPSCSHTLFPQGAGTPWTV